MIRLLDIPGVLAIERRAKLNAVTGVRDDVDLERMVDAVYWNWFNISPDYARGYLRDLDLWIDQCAMEAAERGEPQAENDDDEDAVTEWRADGWDITGEDQFQQTEAACFPLFEAALEVVEDPHETYGNSKVEMEAKLFALRKEAEREAQARASAKNRARDQSFLALGQRRRRTA